ncbi:PREDICTED: homeotic protein ocelliless-like [Ceratosolen solmsi marchali]|uniref:Homeotic protein ocelliless-like n=1 Tax=Ceratosolen solmsi marchali TaxID=326594 RepID=A0AAJ6YV37_9HYME|nr:PREDICTED: homeotic protein ocelliless-like [Ceratosolen solmsi marchali]
MEWTLIFCCLLSVAIVHGRGFYFPDEVESKAQSGAWADGFGNSQANANANSNANRSPLSLYEDDYDGYGSQNFPNRYPSQGYNPYYNRPSYNVNPYPSLNGHFHSNAQSNSQNLGNQYGNGGANAAAAAASAGTGFVNGLPIASAAAAAAAAGASSNGNGASSAASSASAGAGGASRYPGSQYPDLPYPGLYANNYGHRQRQPWLYRSAGDYDSKNFDIVDTIVKGVDSIVFDH